jgi:hypothetical protein
MKDGRHVLAVGPVTVERTAGRCRVTADVGGVPAWFESDDAALAPAAEAFGCAFLIPALHHRARLRLADPVDPAWRENAGALVALLGGWWRYPAWVPEAPRPGPAPVGAPAALREDRAEPRATAGPTAAGGTALFFSGGVDSFHVLLRGGERVDRLVALHGFDFPLDDHARATAVEASLRAVADAAGASAVVVRTNVRGHPRIRGTPWGRAHGGVLGAVAHLLAPAASRVLIASSAPGDREIPWGLHWRVDPLWSSSRVRVVHAGRGGRRLDKLRAIAAEPLVRDHLRVCWANRARVGNCSRCAKCVLAMLILEECGALATSRVFEGREQLAARVAGVRKTPDRSHTLEEIVNGGRLDPTVAAEVRALIRRSRFLKRPDVRLRRAIVRWVVGWTRRARG